MKQWHFFDKVYRVWVAYVIANPDEFKDFLINSVGYTAPLEDLSGSGGMCIHICGKNSTQLSESYIIWQRKYELGCLVHEVTHLSMMVFDAKGIDISLDNTETYAYYSEFWFNEITRTKRRLPQGRMPDEVSKV